MLAQVSSLVWCVPCPFPRLSLTCHLSPTSQIASFSLSKPLTQVNAELLTPLLFCLLQGLGYCSRCSGISVARCRVRARFRAIHYSSFPFQLHCFLRCFAPPLASSSVPLHGCGCALAPLALWLDRPKSLFNLFRLQSVQPRRNA